MKLRNLFVICIFALALPVFSEGEISDFTNQTVYEFITTRVRLKSWEDQAAVEKIAEIRAETMEKLKSVAVDLEQEECILESLFFTETYEHLIKAETRGDLRVGMKNLMKRNMDCINSRKHEKISKWMYLSAGDVTSYYMTRSIAATFFYGFKVKGYYESALDKDSGLTSANTSLGSWLFYAPAPIGSNKRAEKHYKSGLKGAKTDGEKYMAFQYLSQLYYEQKKISKAEEYLQKAYDLELGHKELDKIRACNKAGYSLFQYNRNRAGIDEKIPESEKQEED
ncbi:MAG: hypothetical protein KBT11_06825 [Treponema sp.]|nr:hypothetical protein [Candidatus Treponema equifaecale]